MLRPLQTRRGRYTLARVGLAALTIVALRLHGGVAAQPHSSMLVPKLQPRATMLVPDLQPAPVGLSNRPQYVNPQVFAPLRSAPAFTSAPAPASTAASAPAPRRTPRPSPLVYVARRPGVLPASGAPTVAGIALPPGHRGGSGLAMWASDRTLPGAVGLAARLAAAFPRTGLWPVLWDFDDRPAMYMDGPDDVAGIAHVNVGRTLATLWRQNAAA